ncbi:acyl-CoA dehydrogenase family member 11-like isoform X2 [Orbicella faveolata]|uniref:acyl-CoA dehydrogenase family member 11-like isoform X2 n=1 Tax=Orbicella faveolata TaxID=48498 RepID=UPI0009E1C997|nr:acyl-CoA dehydrogenase family member 11-like isoform X2 [Orbicella faveolata]
MEEQSSEALKLQEYWKQSLVEYTSDSSKLHEYLKQNLVDFPTGDEELKMFKFRAGTSNPTFLLRKNGKEFVLRHKSPVEVHVGYHKVDVEYKIMSALGKTSFPVPKMYLFCEDKTIMGQEFYLMEYIKGRQFPDANLPGVPPDQRKVIFEAAIRTLAQLQSVDTDKLDLDGIGDKENFFHQRLDMLYEGYKQSEIKEIPKAHQLMKWLTENIPKDDKKPVIHHTEFRISNMLFHSEQCQILAVIDWEAASWGHPFEDLAYFCFPHHFPPQLDIFPAFKIGYRSEGIPSEEAMLSLYCELTGDTLPLPNWSFFLVLVFFRVITNIQNGIAQLRSGAHEFPLSIDDLVTMLEPVVGHACTIAGLK